MEFPFTGDFEIFVDELRAILEAELESHPYNTFGSFLKFYQAFRDQSLPFLEFYQNYNAEILPESLSCVGLSCCLFESLISSLSFVYPELKSTLFIASSEEMLIDTESYCNTSPPSAEIAVKEHVLVALKVEIEGREGIVILDPGYHVNIPVIIMSDGKYPHTGLFVVTKTAKAKKEYEYTMKGDYVQWIVKETRGEQAKHWTNLIYIGHEFLSCVSVSEKRNLIFNFRSIVARNKNGPAAGLYCNLEGSKEFSLFYEDENYQRINIKIPFDYFQIPQHNTQYNNALRHCAEQLGYNSTLLSDLMRCLVNICHDSNFMPYVQELNRFIEED